MSTAQLSAVFFLQVFFMLAVCRLVGLLARRWGQPQVVGEMIAGVVMGPSLFGWLFPGWQQAIFPKESLKLLYVLAQLGVGLYMFLVGTEFKTELFRSRARSAASVSIAGMVAPFAVGGILAVWLWKVPGLFSERASQFEAILFMGAAMFFTFSGLNTRLDTVNSPQLFLIGLLVLVGAVAAKGGACWLAARLNGETHQTALAVGTLMNARGLMELIILNIGLQRGLIQPALFSIMVMMAIITTLMTSPLFELVNRTKGKAATEEDTAAAGA